MAYAEGIAGWAAKKGEALLMGRGFDAADYPGLTFEPAGMRKDLDEFFEFLLVGFLMALMFNYCLIAIPLKSYIQPLIIMISIPFLSNIPIASSPPSYREHHHHHSMMNHQHHHQHHHHPTIRSSISISYISLVSS